MNMENSFNGIPVVDIKNFPNKTDFESDPEEIQRITLELDEILQHYGFCYIKNSGINKNVVDDFYSKSKELFGLSREVQQHFEKTGDKGEKYGGFYISKKQSFRERFDIMNKMLPEGIPEEFVPGFTKSIERYRDEFNSCAKFLLSRISVALELSEANNLLNFHRGALFGDDVETKAHLSTIMYKPVTDGIDSGNLMEIHTDFTSLTLLVSSASGLQCQVPSGVGNDNEGEWLNADPKDDWILLHVGDLLERFTAGKYTATVHRVVHVEDKSDERQSIPYFLHPDCHAEIRPVVECKEELKEKYFPITALNYWKQQMKKRTNPIAEKMVAKPFGFTPPAT